MKKKYFSVYVLLIISLLYTNRLAALTYHLKAGGDPLVAADWGTNSAGTTGSPGGFTGNHVWNLATNNSAITIGSTWGVAVGATVNVGNGSANFVLNLGVSGLIGNTGSAPRIVVANQCTLNIGGADNFNVSSTKTFFNTGSTVIYLATASNVTACNNAFYDLIVNADLIHNNGTNTVNDLTINSANSLNGAGVTVGRDLILNADLDLNSGTIDITRNITMNGNVVLTAGAFSLGGTISGTGSFDGDTNGSSLTFSGTGSIGTLNILTPFQVSFLSLFLQTAASKVTLGTDLNINSGLQLAAGALELNGNTLTVENTAAVDFSGGGTIIGSTASTFSCIATTSAGGITGSLNMDATDNNLKALVLNSSGETLTLGSQLNVADFVQVDAGTLATAGNMVLKATNLLTARVGSIGATGSITGNVTTETYVRGPSTGWALWGANGVSGLQVNNWEAQIPMACQGCANGVTSAGGYFESIQSWDESVTTSGQEYDTTIVNTTALTPGKGFWVYVGSSFSTTTDYVISNTGPLVTGPVSIPVTDVGNALVLVSNPYASPISWDAVYAANSGSVGFLSNSIYGFNAEGGGVGSTYSSGGPSGAPTGIDNVIPAGQGFYIDMFAAFSFCSPCQLIIDESMKVSNNTSSNPVIRTSSSASSNSGRPWFRLKLDGFSGDFDQTVFSVMPDATDSYDRKYDGRKIFQTPGYVGYAGAYAKYTSISSKMDTLDYSINTVGPLTHSVTVPVLVRVAASGTYTISLRDFNNYSSCMILHDKLTNALTDLRVNPYVFTMNDTTSAPRFEMVLCENGNTTVSLTELKESFGSVTINQDELGALVTTNFEKNTKATISAYNIMGQQLMEDVEIQGKATTTRLNLNVHNQVVIIRVSSDKETTTKKIIAH